MTRPQAIETILRWDRYAIDRKLVERRRGLWRIMDAIDGRPVTDAVIDALDELEQTDEVQAIRALLGIENREAPCWAGKVAI
jgi:hypothetical protein